MKRKKMDEATKTIAIAISGMIVGFIAWPFLTAIAAAVAGAVLAFVPVVLAIVLAVLATIGLYHLFVR